MKKSPSEIRILKQRWFKNLVNPENPDDNEFSFDYARTFQELLTVRLIEMEKKLLLEIATIDTTKPWHQLREYFREAWSNVAEKDFRNLMEDLERFGLEKFPKLTEREKNDSGRDYVIDLRGANINDFHFIGANLRLANFDYCEGLLTRFDYADCYRASFNYAFLRNSWFIGAFCYQSSFEGTHLAISRFSEAMLVEVDFDYANCSKANFDGAKCAYSRFSFTNCNETSFGAVVRNLENDGDYRNDIFRVINCDLTGIAFNGASFLKVDLSNMDLSSNPMLRKYVENQQICEYMQKRADTFSKKIFLIYFKFRKNIYQKIINLFHPTQTKKAE